MSDHLDLLASTQHLLEEVVKDLKLSEEVYHLLKEPRRVLTVNLLLRGDDGVTRVLKAYRSHHNNALGPYKGGIRFHPAVTLEEVKALSIWMSLKSAVVGIPMGGAKGGVAVDPATLSVTEKERLARNYVREYASFFGVDRDVPAPDVNTNSQTMAWMLDEFDCMHDDANVFGIFTGKPVILGGSRERTEATGLGTAIVVREAAKRLNLNLPQATVAIQGFGNVGSHTARFLAEMGARIVALTDAKGGVFCEMGIDVARALQHAQATGSVAGYPGCRPLTNEELFALPVDVIVPAALENQITASVARTVKARIVAEAANGPTTPEGYEVLLSRNVLVTPDIITNVGGVTVSYFEWVQNRGGWYWTREEVDQRLEAIMTTAFENVYNAGQDRRGDLRRAAYALAVAKLAEAMRVRGWYGTPSQP